MAASKERLYTMLEKKLTPATNPEEKHPLIPGETYRFTVMKTLYQIHEKMVSGQKICEIAGLIPPEKYKLDMRMDNGKYREVPLDMVIDLSEPGIEKFVYITRDQTEG